MCYARVAASVTNAWCVLKFDDVKMASTIFNGSYADAFDHTGYGTHKYIPADRLTRDLGEREGAGVYGFWHMKDGSYALLTCDGAMAWWSGKDEDAAQWGECAREPMKQVK